MNGAVGCLTRVPLPRQAFSLNYHQEAAAAEGPSSGGGPTAAAPSRFSQELWTPYLRDTALRVFASCALSAQVTGRQAAAAQDLHPSHPPVEHCWSGKHHCSTVVHCLAEQVAVFGPICRSSWSSISKPRPFQAGRFTKAFADYTAASVRLDLGLTSPDGPVAVVGLNGHANGSGRLSKQPGNGQAGSRLFRHR